MPPAKIATFSVFSIFFKLYLHYFTMVQTLPLQHNRVVLAGSRAKKIATCVLIMS